MQEGTKMIYDAMDALQVSPKVADLAGKIAELDVADIAGKWDRITTAHKKEFKAVYPNKIDTYDIPTLKKMVEQIDLAIEQA